MIVNVYEFSQPLREALPPTAEVRHDVLSV